jgi:Uncharacterised nucleotidyltransferase
MSAQADRRPRRQTDAERRLVDWLGAVVAGDAVDLGEIDDEFAGLLAGARLLPLAARHGAVHPRVATTERVAFTRAVMTARLSDRFVSALAESGVPSVTLRGPALGAAFWGDAALRPSVDIDILVSPADVPAARRVLESVGLSGSDIRPLWYVRHWHFNESYSGGEPRAVVELHWNVVRPHAGRVAIAALVAEAETVVWQGARLRTPSPVWHMLVCAVHAVSHYFSLRELLDIAFIARKLSPPDWQRVVALARSSHLAPALYYAVAVSAERFGWQPPDELRGLRPSALRDTLAWRYLASLPATGPPGTGTMQLGKVGAPLVSVSGTAWLAALPMSLTDRPLASAALEARLRWLRGRGRPDGEASEAPPREPR